MASRRSVGSQNGSTGVEVRDDHDTDEAAKITMEEELESKYGIHKEHVKWTEQARKTLKKTCSCSGPKAKRILFRKIPILDWLPKYKIRQNLLGDIIAGLTVGIVHLPQGLAYGDLAGLAPINGLYVSFFPVLAFMLLGTSKHVSVGTYAVISIMVANVIGPNSADQCDVNTNTPPDIVGSTASAFTSAETTSEVIDSTSAVCYEAKLRVAVALALSCGIIQILMSIFRLGIITTYLSTHLISGFTCGAAFHVLTSQIPKLLGLSVARQSGPLALIYTYIEIFENITKTNWATVIVSACCIVFLVIGKEINQRFRDELPLVIPWELGVIILATIASYFGYFNENYNVPIVGNIPTGIQTSIPSMSLVGQVIVDAIAISIVAFATEISLAQMFSEKHSYKVDADQELLALGAGNIVGSFFCCYPAAISLSRSIIWDESGGKTQLTGAFSSVLILIILLWIGPLFQSLPNAALASIIVVNLKGMLRQFEKIPPLWRVSKIDALIWIVEWTAVFLLGVSVGLAVGLLFEIFTVVVRDQLMNGAVIGKVGITGEYRSSKEYHTKTQDDRIVIFQYPGPLNFANKTRFQKQISTALRFDPFMASKTMKTEPKGHISTVTESLTFANGHVTDKIDDINLGEDDIIRNKKAESVDLESLSLPTISYPSSGVSHLILDMSCCPYVDNDGAQIIKKLYGALTKVDVNMYIACCCSDIRRALSLVCEDKPPPCYVSIDSALDTARTTVSNDTTSDSPSLTATNATTYF